MKALVLGSTGFLGSNLIRALLERKYEVRAFHRPTSRTIGIDQLPVEHALGDFLDRDALLKALRGCDLLFHVGAFYPKGLMPAKEAAQRALGEVRSIMEAALQSGVQRMIYGSALTTIGPPIAGELADERSPFSTPYVQNPYLMSKAAMEDEVAHYVSSRHLSAVIAVPTVLLGPYDVKPTSGQQIIMITRGLMPFYIEGKTNVVDVRDVARGLILLAERGRIGERYILGGVNTTQGALNRLIAKEAGVRGPVLPVPFQLARWGAQTGDFLFTTFLRRPPPIPSFFLEVLHQMGHYDLSKAREELGYAPGPIEPAIQDALRWFRENRYL